MSDAAWETMEQDIREDFEEVFDILDIMLTDFDTYLERNKNDLLNTPLYIDNPEYGNFLKMYKGYRSDTVSKIKGLKDSALSSFAGTSSKKWTNF